VLISILKEPNLIQAGRSTQLQHLKLIKDGLANHEDEILSAEYIGKVVTTELINPSIARWELLAKFDLGILNPAKSEQNRPLGSGSTQPYEHKCSYKFDEIQDKE
jgi:hypothetical protein